MKIQLLSLAMFASLALMTGCSKSDDDESNTNSGGDGPGRARYEWLSMNDKALSLDIDFAGNDSKPDWQSPSPADYESWMIYQVTLPYELRSWASEDDLMAVFINDKIRVVASPAIKDLAYSQTYETYILKILGNTENTMRQQFDYKYYSARLNRIFEMQTIGHFNPETVLGVDTEFCLLDLARESVDDIYPVVCTLELELPEELTEESDDTESYIAVFVGNECRGIAKIKAKEDEVRLFAYGKKSGEKADIYCINYSYYTKLKPTVSLENDTLLISLE